ncbi:phosphotransferase family protein [Gordonia hydrophobica]|uniref:Phosphotransferase family protein n=1 Tax=Gordonia hydrophobica TaxID=40516 RepID=A0ABZ2U0D7_9ACTN|nr:phosphotransferase family protein [Gordonia hydrophobica]MBM7367721.1 aminoglycoside phosphotransferase (APT) family kinase protein [Gordonia hydrophobica]
MTAEPTARQHPGLDLDVLTPWFVENVGAVSGQLNAELIAGGKSNLTYRLYDDQQRWILRRPPVGKLLATAHDMGREYTMMSALASTDVPVPVMYALGDAELLGAPFYVMEAVDGTPYRKASELAELGPERTRAISERLVDTLAVLHQVEPAQVGLGDFGHPEGFLARQVARWRKQFDAAHTRDLPAMERLHALLAEQVPPDAAPGIVHGDYRLDNVLVDDSDQPRAVLDWELSTIGDSLTDLALMSVYHRMGAAGGGVTDVAVAPGFLSDEEVVARYAAASGRDLTNFGFYVAYSCFKLAGIVEGIHYRFTNGQTVGDGFADVGATVEPLLQAGLAALKEN